MYFRIKNLKEGFWAHRIDVLALLFLSMLALLIRFGYMAEYPNSIMHEDSGPYVDEAERMIEGRPTVGGQIPGRAPGYPIFLTTIISLASPNLLYIIGIQHLLGIVSSLLLTLSLRMANVGRLLSYVFFISVAFAHRMIHYDNTIGAETLTMFLVSGILFLAAGMVMRRWNPWTCSITIGLLATYLILVRSATFFIPLVLAIWLALPSVTQFLSGWRHRLGLIALILIPPISSAAGMIQWNKTHYNRAVLSREAEPAMAFVIAYSGDFSEHGPRYIVLDSYPGMREQLHAIVSEGRATLKEDGYSTVHHYQWPFNIFNALDIQRFGSQQEKDRVVSGVFWDTVLTGSTLYRHLSEHTWREMRFMLLDATSVSNSTQPPSELINFTKRDGSALRIAQVRSDWPSGVGISHIAPGAIGESIQRMMSRYVRNKYTTEYRQRPGMLHLYSILSLWTIAIMLLLFLFRARWLASLRLDAKRPSSAGDGKAVLSVENSLALLAFMIWFGYALMTCTLVYALHRYSYYIYALNTFTAFYGLHQIYRWLQTRMIRNSTVKRFTHYAVQQQR